MASCNTFSEGAGVQAGPFYSVEKDQFRADAGRRCVDAEGEPYSFASCLACFGFAKDTLLFAAEPERTLDEIKTEAIHRAENGNVSPVGLDPADVKEAFASIHTSDKDEWAAGFMGVADRYMAEAKAWRLRRQAGSHPSQRRLHSRLAFVFLRALAAARFSGQKAVLREGDRGISRGTRDSTIRRSKWCTFRLKGKPSPATCACRKVRLDPFRWFFAINGLDSRKEDLTENFSAILAHGVGYIAVDGPGTDRRRFRSARPPTACCRA